MQLLLLLVVLPHHAHPFPHPTQLTQPVVPLPGDPPFPPVSFEQDPSGFQLETPESSNAPTTPDSVYYQERYSPEVGGYQQRFTLPHSNQQPQWGTSKAQRSEAAGGMRWRFSDGHWHVFTAQYELVYTEKAVCLFQVLNHDPGHPSGNRHHPQVQVWLSKEGTLLVTTFTDTPQPTNTWTPVWKLDSPQSVFQLTVYSNGARFLVYLQHSLVYTGEHNRLHGGTNQFKWGAYTPSSTQVKVTNPAQLRLL